MATVKPVLRMQKKSRDGRVPIWLRILDGKRQLHVSTGLKTLPSRWNPRTGRLRKSHPHADLVNRILAQMLDRAEAEMLRLRLEGKRATGVHLQTVLRHGESNDLIAFAARHLADLKKRGNVARHRRLTIMLDKLQSYAGETLPFDRITPAFLEEWQTYMLTVEGNKQTTIGTNLSDLRAFINRAVKEDLLPLDKNPFLRFSIDRGQGRERTKLSFAEVERIRALDLAEGTLLWHVRNYWLFAFFAAGVRFKDLAFMTQAGILEGENRGPDRLVYRMSKTGKPQSVLLAPPARKILSYYLDGGKDPHAFIFPILAGRDISTPEKVEKERGRANALVNKYLRKLAERAAINKPLTTHTARHSFADLARTEGWSIYDISKALQHHSIQVTERYLQSFDSKALDERMGELFG